MSEEQALHITGVHLKNIGGIKEFKAKIGSVCVVIGRNGEGKTSFLEGIRLPFDGGHDGSVIRKEDLDGDGIYEAPVPRAESTLTLSDGSTFNVVITEKESKLTVKSADGGKVSRAATYVRDLAPEMSFDPLGFLKKEPKERMAFLLRTLPLTFDPAEVNKALNVPVGKIAMEPLPQISGVVNLQRFNEIWQGKYDERTELNHQARNLSGIIEDLERSLPSGDEKDWAAERESLQAQINDLGEQIARAESEIKLEGESKKNEQRESTDKNIAEAKKVVSTFIGSIANISAGAERFSANPAEDSVKVLQQAFAATAASLGMFIDACRQIPGERRQLEEYVAHVDQKVLEVTKRETEALLKQKEDLSVQLGTAQARADEGQRAQGIRDAIATNKKQHSGVTLKVMRLEAIMKAMDKLKIEKLKKLPIHGLDITTDAKNRPVITINGIPLDQLNAQQQIYVAIQAVKQAAGRLPLIICEAAELEEDHLLELAEACIEAKIQLIVAMRIRQEPLRVLSYDEYREMVGPAGAVAAL